MNALKYVLPAAAIFAAATPAQAALVNAWAYTITSSFTNSKFEKGTGTIRQFPDRISWGPGSRGAVRSAIGVDSTPTKGVVETNGAPAAADDYYHENFVLPTGTASLLSTTLNINIALTPIDPVGSPAAPIKTSFAINFFETPNNPTNNRCADGGTRGVGINSEGCADIFTLAFSSGQFDFTYDNIDYSLFLFEDPSKPKRLGTLSDAACTAVGAPLGCFGFLTPENQRTLAEFVIGVEADVPEPAMLGLLGLGVLGIATARRRKA